MQGSRQLKKKKKSREAAVVYHDLASVRPEILSNGSSASRDAERSINRDSSGKTESKKKQGAHFRKYQPPWDCWRPWGDLGANPKWQTDGWTFLLKERRTHAGKATSNPRLLVKKSSRGTHTQNLEGKIGKARKAGIETDLSLQQLLTRSGSKMSLKLPRNWDFNLKVEAGKIGTANVFLLPLGSHTWAPTICMLVCRELHLLKNGSLSKSEFGGNLHSSWYVGSKFPNTGRGFFSFGRWCWNGARRCVMGRDCNGVLQVG